MLKNAQDADDMAQEVFLDVYQKIGTFRGESRLTTWMYRLSTNKCLEEIRRRKRQRRWASLVSFWKSDGEAIEPPEFDHPGVQLENKERASLLMLKMEQLPDNQRVAFTLHKLDGMPYEQIAEVMETSLSAVESLIFRAKQNLKKLLKEYYEKEMI